MLLSLLASLQLFLVLAQMSFHCSSMVLAKGWSTFWGSLVPTNTQLGCVSCFFFSWVININCCCWASFSFLNSCTCRSNLSRRVFSSPAKKLSSTSRTCCFVASSSSFYFLSIQGLQLLELSCTRSIVLCRAALPLSELVVSGSLFSPVSPCSAFFEHWLLLRVVPGYRTWGNRPR